MRQLGPGEEKISKEGRSSKDGHEASTRRFLGGSKVAMGRASQKARNPRKSKQRKSASNVAFRVGTKVIEKWQN